MNLTLEQNIMLASFLIALLLMIFAVDWRYLRDWIVVFLVTCVIDFVWGSPVVNLKLLDYPVRLLPEYYNTCIFSELWIFPSLCVLYNQVTRKKGFLAIIYYAVFFSAGMTAIEYCLETYTNLIKYLQWSWFTTFYTLIITLLTSRAFITFFRWGCDHFARR
jgi:hypothetical protein